MAAKRTRKQNGSRKGQRSASQASRKSSPDIGNEPANALPALSIQEVQVLSEDPRLKAPQRGNPELSAGDVDAAWDRGDEGEETVGGSHATPDQDVVEELGRAVGITYSDNEPLRLGEKEEERDSQRWELDPASSEDYQEHAGQGKRRKIKHTEQA